MITSNLWSDQDHQEDIGLQGHAIAQFQSVLFREGHVDNHADSAAMLSPVRVESCCCGAVFRYSSKNPRGRLCKEEIWRGRSSMLSPAEAMSSAPPHSLRVQQIFSRSNAGRKRERHTIAIINQEAGAT